MERKKTKIVATLGPASREERVLQALIEVGMNVARLNLSHGTREEHRALLAGVRRAARALGEAVAVMADTPGQAIRIGPVKDDRVSLQAGRRVTLTEEPIVGDPQRIPVDFPGFSQHVRPGMEVLLANGDIRLKTIEVRPGEVVCEVLNSGILGSRKRVNVPEAKIPVAAHDDEDLQFAAELGVEYLAASFVQTAEDIKRVREGLGDRGIEIEVIAKIETREAVENIDEIIAASDGVMVARGDLGVELPMEEVPLIQKEIVRKSNSAGVPVIIATQMLRSMTENPRPTRAEVADVANAILDGADALMLSEETAVGRYPVEAVRVMSTVAGRIERAPDIYHKYHKDSTSVTEAIGESACQIAERIEAAAIIPSTTSGSTAKLVAKFRPRIPIIAVTYSETVRNKLALIWGIYPLLVESSDDTELMLRRSIEAVAREMQLPKGATVVITAGVPFGVPGTTNFIKVEHV
jgi:pyruvate kinase